MPKRKVSDSEDEDYIKKEDSNSSISAEDSASEKNTKKQKAVDKPSANKRVKEEVKEEVEGSTTKLESSTSAPVKIHTTSEGDKYIDLGKKKRATVRSFKGVPLIDIREFYGPDGDEKPGKKGISLTIEQWQYLRDGISTIDKLLDQVKKK